MWLNNYLFGPFIPANCDKPPTIYAILESIVNGDKDYDDDQVKIKDLAKEGRSTIFDFDYPLSNTMTKEYFECMLLNHYMTRRIGFDTVTNFKLHLMVKLNAIMPKYNLLFDSYSDLLNTRTITKSGTDNTNSSNTQNSSNQLTNSSDTSTHNTNDNRFSDTGQGQLEITDVQNGDYLTDYTYTQSNLLSNITSTSNANANSNGSGVNNRTYNETITENDNENTYYKIQNEMHNVFDMIFKDLDTLFYSIV